jgi:hypothetical protein
MASCEVAALGFLARRQIVIGGGCPLAFGRTAGAGHTAMRLVFTCASKAPGKV